MGKMLETAASVLKDWISLILLGLGITFSPHVYFGGLFLAFAGAAISRAVEREQAHKQGLELPKESSNRFFLVIGTAFFVSTLTAIIINSNFPSWSVQVVMAASGFASRKFVMLFLSVIDRLGHKGDTIADRLLNRVLPVNNDKDSSNG